MASGKKTILSVKGKDISKYFDPNGIYAPTLDGFMWKKTTLHKDGVEYKNICVPVRACPIVPKTPEDKLIGDLSKKIIDTKEAEVEIARQKNQESEKHKVCMQQYEDSIENLQENITQLCVSIKKKDADNKSAGIVQTPRTKLLEEKTQKGFMNRFKDRLEYTDISVDDIVWKAPKAGDPDYNVKMHGARVTGRIRLGPGVPILPGSPPTQPQKRKIDDVHESDEEDLVILGEWPCEKKGTAVQKNEEIRVRMYGEDDPLDESIVDKWMKTWEQYTHHGNPK